jgi:hypothetical protein
MQSHGNQLKKGFPMDSCEDSLEGWKTVQRQCDLCDHQSWLHQNAVPDPSSAKPPKYSQVGGGGGGKAESLENWTAAEGAGWQGNRAGWMGNRLTSTAKMDSIEESLRIGSVRN